jgi:acyl-CoA thioesterase I
VVLMGVRGGLLDDKYDTEFEALAEETGSVYVDDVLDGLFGQAKYMSDSIHPNDAGYAIIAAKVYPKLAPLLQ